MAIMKPRTGNGPLETVKEGRKVVVYVPADGGGCLVVKLPPEEAEELGAELVAVVE